MSERSCRLQISACVNNLKIEAEHILISRIKMSESWSDRKWRASEKRRNSSLLRRWESTIVNDLIIASDAPLTKKHEYFVVRKCTELVTMSSINVRGCLLCSCVCYYDVTSSSYSSALAWKKIMRRKIFVNRVFRVFMLQVCVFMWVMFMLHLCEHEKTLNIDFSLLSRAPLKK